MKPTDLDDATPVEPDDETLVRVRARSRSFRRRRNAQRFVTAASGVLVVALAVGIAVVRVSSGDSRPAGPATTRTPSVTMTALAGPWSPVTLADYGGPLTAPPLQSVPRLEIKTDETFSGSDGCNDLSGSFQLGPDGSFEVRHHFSTAVGCREEVPLLDVLDAATRVQVVDTRLEVFADHGRELAIFARAGITARLELPSDTITAGTSVNAQVVVENDTGQPVRVFGCVSYFEVLLVNDDVHQGPNWLLCRQSFTFPVGSSRHRLMVSARYNSCTAVSVEGPDPNQFPRCQPDKNPPPLPPGDYQATLFQTGDAVSIAPPLTLHVVAPR